MAYTRVNWENSPSTDTPINIDNLNTLDAGIANVDTRLTTAESDITTLETNQGTLSNLTTTEKTNLVGAINEVDSHTDTNTTDITNLKTGWNVLGATLTYASWTAGTYTGVMGTNIDLTPIISVGMKMSISQTTIKYFMVTKITSTQITGFFGTDYTLANATISSPKYSTVKSPYEFPMNPDKWSITVTNAVVQNKVSPVQDTIYYADLGSINTVLPVGVWNRKLSIFLRGYRGTAGPAVLYAALSSSNSSISDTKMQAISYNSPVQDSGSVICIEDIVDISTNTTYYLVGKTTQTGIGNLVFDGSAKPTVIKSVCAYL